MFDRVKQAEGDAQNVLRFDSETKICNGRRINYFTIREDRPKSELVGKEGSVSVDFEICWKNKHNPKSRTLTLIKSLQFKDETDRTLVISDYDAIKTLKYYQILGVVVAIARYNGLISYSSYLGRFFKKEVEEAKARKLDEFREAYA